MLSRRVTVTAGSLDEQLELAQTLRKYGGDERIMERERQIESYLTQSGLSDEQRHAAIKDLRATHTQRRFRDVRVYFGSERISARIQAYNKLAGGRWEPKDREDQRQFDQVKKDFELVKEEFQAAGTNKAYAVLMASAQVIFSSLAKYGIVDSTPVDTAIKAVHLGGKSAESQAAVWLDTARRMDGRTYRDAYHARGAVSNREQFAKDVDKLIGLQEKARKAAEVELKARAKNTSLTGSVNVMPAKRGQKHRPKDPEHAAAWDALQAARQALDVAWLDVERANPALAAYRGRGGELANIDLGKQGLSGDQRLGRTLTPVVQKLVNIHEAIAALEQGKLKPLSLTPVVKATRAQLLIPPGSTFDPAVKAAVAEAGETNWAMKIMDAVMFAMTFTGLGSLVSGAYGLLKEYAKYESDTRLSNTALDASKSISDADPSLAGFVMAALDLGLSIHQVRSLFKKAQTLKKAMLEEGDQAARQAAREQLDELGEQAGVRGLAEQVEKRELRGAAPTAPVAAKPPPTTPTPPAMPRNQPWTFKKRPAIDPPEYGSSTARPPRKKIARPANYRDPETGIRSGMKPRPDRGTGMRIETKGTRPKKGPFSDADIEKAVKKLERRPPAKGAKLPEPDLAPVDVEVLTGEAKEGVRAMLGKRWVGNPEFGTRLHAQLAASLEDRVKRGWKIEVEKELGASIGKGQSVRRWLEVNGDPSGLISSLPAKVLDQTVDNLKPDLVLRASGGRVLVWDLTSRESAEHLAKTQLYAQILAKEGHLVQIAESYWDDRFVAEVVKAQKEAEARLATRAAEKAAAKAEE